MWILMLTMALAADYNLSDQIAETEKSESEISEQVGASAPRVKIDTSDLTQRAPADAKRRERLEGVEESVVAPLTSEYFQPAGETTYVPGSAAEQEKRLDSEFKRKRK